MDILPRLKELIVGDAFEKNIITSGKLAERLLIDRRDAVTEIERLLADKDRLERGISEIGEYLNQEPPRVGDASWSCEALLAGSANEQTSDSPEKI